MIQWGSDECWDNQTLYRLLDSIRGTRKYWIGQKFHLGFHYTLRKNPIQLIGQSSSFKGLTQFLLLSSSVIFPTPEVYSSPRLPKNNLKNTFLSLLKSGTSLTTLSWDEACVLFLFPFLLGWIIFIKCLGLFYLKQTASLFSSKNWFIWDQQRIAIQGLQPQWTMYRYRRLGIEKLFYGRGKESESAVVNKESVAFHWLSFDSVSLAELWPGKKRKSFFFRLVSAIREHESSPFWTPNSILIVFSVY